MKKSAKQLMGLLIVLAAAVFPQRVGAEYTLVEQNVSARVIQVVDGDALKISISGTGEIALIRLAGIAADGSREAFDYTTQQLLGRDILVVLDKTIENVAIDNRWTPAYVYYDDNLYNQLLLQKGFARVDSAYENISVYDSLLNDERVAQERELGNWAAPAEGNISFDDAGADQININTASVSQLRDALNISAAAARDIVYYREENPYNTVMEIKYSGGLERAAYDENLSLLTVNTNVNTATEEELRMSGFSSEEIRDIVEYREERRFNDIGLLYTEDIISEGKYEDLGPFLTVNYADTVVYSIPSDTADINDDSEDTLHGAGLSDSEAEKIAENRINGYSYKTIGELQMVRELGLSEAEINALADNLFVDSTSASALDNLFTPAYINLNTATVETMISAGFTRNQALDIRQARTLHSADDLPENLGAMDAYCSLYTNINMTTETELLSLSEGMSQEFANILLDAAALQPFGSMRELSGFFAEYDETDLFRDIRDYIVLR